MANQVQVIYEHGVLRPLQPMGLSEGEKVTLSLIRPFEPPPDDLCGFPDKEWGFTDGTSYDCDG